MKTSDMNLCQQEKFIQFISLYMRDAEVKFDYDTGEVVINKNYFNNTEDVWRFYFKPL